MRGVLIALLLLCSAPIAGALDAGAQDAGAQDAGAQDAGAQDGPSLGEAAERARRAWFAHDAAALVAGSPSVQVQLPGADPSAALGPAQAAALLADFLAPAQEVATVVRAAREVEPGQGYVEVQRRYRVAGTQEVRAQSILLGYRLGPGGWQLVELRVIG